MNNHVSPLNTSRIPGLSSLSRDAKNEPYFMIKDNSSENRRLISRFASKTGLTFVAVVLRSVPDHPLVRSERDV